MIAALLFAANLILSLATAYFCVLALAAALRSLRTPVAGVPASRIVVVVPAHDEELGLPATLASLKAMDYPKDLFQIVVVADNCSDATAQVAVNAGVRCLERRDEGRRGKGYALRFAFDRLLEEGFDALAVIDADNQCRSDFLRCMDARLRSGQAVIQARNVVGNPTVNALTWILAVGNAVENDLYSRGKAALSLSSPLRGTGMCFSAEVLRRVPWAASSIAEDAEYGLALAEQGISVHFASETEVWSDAPATLAAAATQRIRWASGNMGMARRSAFAILSRGVRSRNPVLADCGWSMLMRSKPLLLAASFLSALASAWAGIFAAWGAALLLAWFAYYGGAVWVAGVSRRSLGLTLAAPFYVAWLVAVSALGMAGFRGKQWARTERQ